jgi:hypothetical protein
MDEHPREMTAPGGVLLVTGSKHSSTRSNARKRAHSVVVSEMPPSTVASPDYADAFEVTRSPTDRRSAEQWARDGFERLPVTIRRSGLLIHRWILGFRLGPRTSSKHVFGWQIVTSEPELLHLEARSTLLRGHMVWRLHHERLVMTTFLEYEVRRTAPVVWAVIGNIHRGAAPYLLELAATTRKRRSLGSKRSGERPQR